MKISSRIMALMLCVLLIATSCPAIILANEAPLFSPVTSDGEPVYVHNLTFDNMSTETIATDLAAYETSKSNFADMSITADKALSIAPTTADTHHMLTFNTTAYKAMSDNILLLKNNPELRERLSKGSLEKGKELSLDDKAKKVLEYIFD